jgi:hypothetical protein
LAKVKYDVSAIPDIESNHAPVGTYVLTVEDVDGPKPSSQGNTMLEVRLKPTHDAQGKKLKEDYSPLWHYPLLDHDSPFVQARLKEFIAAFGLKPSGTLDTEKQIKGKKVLARLKADTDQDGDYRPRVGKLMKFEASSEPEEPEEAEEEEEEPEEDAINLDDLNRTQLKKLIKDEGLDIKVLKNMDDDKLRELIAEAMGADEEEEEEPEEEEKEEEETEEEEEPEAEEGEEEGDGYDNMSVAELKAELKERELPTNGARKVLVGRLRKDDQGEPF